MGSNNKKLLAFPYYGGKFIHLDWLLPLLPKANTFVDVFGGSGVVMMNRDPSPVEVYNDLNGEIVNFFKQLRDHGEELISLLELTPVSRQEYNVAISDKAQEFSDIERARLFYIKIRQVRETNLERATETGWRYVVTQSRCGKSSNVSSWLNSTPKLKKVCDRLLQVQIECDDALSILDRYDSEGTLFYCDPPYVHSTRVDKCCYVYEMEEEQHRRLLEKVCGVRGKVAVSGYDCELYREYLREEEGWIKYTRETKVCSGRGSKESKKKEKGNREEGKEENLKRVECLWCNYEDKQMMMF